MVEQHKPNLADYKGLYQNDYLVKLVLFQSSLTLNQEHVSSQASLTFNQEDHAHVYNNAGE